jgi:DNA phosphorothioation-dependent restriction protein DptG
MLKVIIAKFFGIYNGEEPTYGDLFSKAKEEAGKLYAHIKNDEEVASCLTAMRMMAPLYELYDMVEYTGKYTDKKKSKMENELRNVIDDAIHKGLFDGKKCTVKEFASAGIELDAVQLMLI